MKRLNQQLSIGSRAQVSHQGLRVAAATLLIAATVAATQAAGSSLPKIVRTEGGISPKPVVTSVAKTADPAAVQVEWQGFGGPYEVVKCPGLNSASNTWTTVTTVTNGTTALVPVDGEAGFISVQGPDPAYAGAERCGICHIDTHAAWVKTGHAGALQTLKNIGQDKNTRCLACHTVAYGVSTGFIDEATTSHLAGVQCENCHGPAAAHARNPLRTKPPIVTLTAEMCGGCHNDAHHPFYDEWATSGHGSLEIPHEEFADPATGPGRMGTCGACHSGATRLALLNSAQWGTPVEMPSTEEAAGTAITCAVCHTSHEATPYGAQLRFPLHSEIPYSYTTATNFVANFNPQVQTCAQCHNMRGATWRGTSRPPHHSPQYNLLIGNGGVEGGETEIPQSAHMKIQNQCAQCHTHAHQVDEVTEQTPNYTGHDFKPSMKGCAPCHDELGGELLTEVVQANTKKQIAEIKGLLDQWATTKASEALRTKYGALAWEFQNIGQLSTPTAAVPRGPSATEQAEVPDNIKQARYNLYLVEHDASYGVHNGNYTRYLLKVARDKVKAEL